MKFRLVSPARGALPGSTSPALAQALKMTETIRIVRKSLLWGFVNVTLLSLFLYDLSYKCPFYTSFFHYFEYIGVMVCSLNAVYHFYRYVYYYFSIKPVSITPKQKQLLGVKNADTHFKVTSTPVGSPVPNVTPDTGSDNTLLNLSALSWRSRPNESANFSISSTSSSWVYHRGSPEARNTSPTKLHYPDTSGVDFIDDEKSLSRYLNDYEKFEKSSVISNTPEPQGNLLSSFWNHPATQTNVEASPLLKRCQYQLASVSTSSSNSPGKSDETGSPLNVLSKGMDVWRRLDVEAKVLTQWNANLRMWISQTILERLVAEIEHIDEALQRQYLNDVRIGGVGLDRLRKTAQMLTVVQHISSLPALIPFLEVTHNQEYLVSRIRELAKGGCMSEFKWNAGGDFNGKPWDDSLPTDSTIVMHLLASYLDTQLLPLPSQPDAKPFTSQHFRKPPEKLPVGSNVLVIHEVSEKPPHYRLVVGDEIHEFPMGRNNLFHTILLFLYYVNKRENGMLGRVNLGRSGVNMMWVIDC